MSVVHDEFATTDLARVEDIIRRLYLDQRLSIAGRREGFTFDHRTAAVDGPAPFATNRLRCALTVSCRATPAEDLLMVDDVHQGSLRFGDSSSFAEADLGPGDVLLSPPTGDFVSEFTDLDADVTALGTHAVAEHAAARTGIAAGALRFTGLTPIGPGAARHWRRIVAHVRDDVLADPEIAAIPMVLASAFQTLATALLATFPNTALDAIVDPLAPPPGRVGDRTVDAAVDFVHRHADEPLGPTDVAEFAGAPARDVDDALRRKRDTTLAEQLWRARMQGAYRDLYDGDAAVGDTVAAIAARWGFVRPATFAVAYTLATGGETPAQTLRR